MQCNCNRVTVRVKVRTRVRVKVSFRVRVRLWLELGLRNWPNEQHISKCADWPNVPSLFLVHPASKTHWATRFLQLLLSSAASSTSSQLVPIFLIFFLMTSFQFCCCRPGLLLKPSGSHVRACHGSLRWSIRERCPSHLRCLHLIMSSNFGSAVASLTFSFVTLSFQEIPRILCCHLSSCLVLQNNQQTSSWSITLMVYRYLVSVVCTLHNINITVAEF